MSTAKKPDDIETLIAKDPELAEAYESGLYAQRAARLITQMREARGFTKAQLAARMGVTPPRITEAENPKGNDGPTYRVMSRVAEACGFRWPNSVEELIPLAAPAKAEAAEKVETAVKQYVLVETVAANPDRKSLPTLSAEIEKTAKALESLLGATTNRPVKLSGLAERYPWLFGQKVPFRKVRILGKVTFDKSGEHVQSGAKFHDTMVQIKDLVKRD